MPELEIDPLYLQMFEAGLLDYSKPNCLVLSDTEWWPPDEVKEYQPFEGFIPGFVLFAKSGAGDRWCWYTEWTAGGETAVVYSPVDEDVARGYAPSFAGCIYRLLLEEMSNSTLSELRGFEGADVGEVFRRYAEDVAPFLPAAWVDTLRELSRRELRTGKYGEHSVLTPQEAGEIVTRDLAFEGLNVQFKQYDYSKFPT